MIFLVVVAPNQAWLASMYTGFPIAMSDYPIVDFSFDELNPMNIPFHILGKL